MIRKIKKSVPGYMKRDRIEKVRSIHNAQDIMGLDDDKNEWDDKSALSALHETKKKKKKKARSPSVEKSTESESKKNELKFARSADSIDRKKKNNKEKVVSIDDLGA